MKKLNLHKLTAALLLTGTVILCSLSAFASNGGNMGTGSGGGGFLGDLGRAAEDMGDGIRDGVNDMVGNGTANNGNDAANGSNSSNNGNNAANSNAPIGQGGTENSGNNRGSVDGNSAGNTAGGSTGNTAGGTAGNSMGGSTGNSMDGSMSESMNGMRNGRTADGGNGDGVIENGTETGTLGDESADGTNSPVTTGEEDGGTNWAAIWIAIIIAVALVAVIVALIPKRRNG